VLPKDENFQIVIHLFPLSNDQSDSFQVLNNFHKRNELFKL